MNSDVLHMAGWAFLMKRKFGCVKSTVFTAIIFNNIFLGIIYISYNIDIIHILYRMTCIYTENHALCQEVNIFFSEEQSEIY